MRVLIFLILTTMVISGCGVANKPVVTQVSPDVKITLTVPKNLSTDEPPQTTELKKGWMVPMFHGITFGGVRDLTSQKPNANIPIQEFKGIRYITDGDDFVVSDMNGEVFTDAGEMYYSEVRYNIKVTTQNEDNYLVMIFQPYLRSEKQGANLLLINYKMPPLNMDELIQILNSVSFSYKFNFKSPISARVMRNSFADAMQQTSQNQYKTKVDNCDMTIDTTFYPYISGSNIACTVYAVCSGKSTDVNIAGTVEKMNMQLINLANK